MKAKRITAFALTLSMLLGSVAMTPANVFAGIFVGGETRAYNYSEPTVIIDINNDTDPATELINAVNNADTSGTPVIIEVKGTPSDGASSIAIDLPTALTVPTGANVTIEGPSSVQTDSATESPIVIKAASSVTDTKLLTVNGTCTLEGVTIDASNMQYGVYENTGANLTLNNKATIKNACFPNNDGSASYYGLYVGRATCVLNDGARITGNDTGVYVDAMLIAKATLTMNEGAIITENTYRGIYNSIGTLNINGADVTHNGNMNNILAAYASSYGGGIFNRSGTVNLNAGSTKETNISDNSAWFGGGIYCANAKATLNINAGCDISGNSAYLGGGIYAVQTNVNLSGGTIENNTATVDPYFNRSGNGAGVYITASGTFTMSAGIIKENKILGTETDSNFGYRYLQGHGGGIFLNEGSSASSVPTLKLGGGTITGNQALQGSGVYASNNYLQNYQEGSLVDNSIYKNTYASSCIDVYGSPIVSGNTELSDGAADDIFLAPTEQVGSDTSDGTQLYPQKITVTGALGSGAVLGVSKQAMDYYDVASLSTVTDNVVAAAGTGYTMTATDLSVFELTSTGITDFTGLHLTSDGSALTVDKVTPTIQVSDTGDTYAGNPLTPTIKVLDGDKELTEGTDYTVSYKDNVSAGTATVTVTGEGLYAGSADQTFTVSAKDMSADGSGITVDSITAQAYTGQAATPDVVVKDGSTTLVKDTDYTVSYKDNVNVGTATVTITGKGNYTGTKTATFQIKALDISSASVSAIADQTYTGKALKPSATVKDGSTVLKAGTDYTLSYKDNTATGKATVTITGKGSYAGTKAVSFRIVPKKATLSTAKNVSTKKIKASWKRDTMATGYQVRYSTSISFAKGVVTKGIYKNSTVSYTTGKLTKGKTYYISVRSYKTIGGKACYGAWSSTKSVKISK